MVNRKSVNRADIIISLSAKDKKYRLITYSGILITYSYPQSYSDSTL